MNSEILLCTLNSTYQHASFGLRYLKKNLDDLSDRCEILEFTIKENPRSIVEKILLYSPKIVGFGLYIWNSAETLQVLSILKKVAPEIIVVLGGPEITYETETQPHLNYCNFVIKGEADFSFRQFCSDFLLNGQLPEQKILTFPLPDIKLIKLPYDLYSDEDIKNRIIYVEASRGCPYKCEYCLSSLDKSVRSFDIEVFLSELQKLIVRGARTFKFVDRTFNLSPTTSSRILQFFLEQIHLGFFLHFEMVPDRLPTEIRDLVIQFPAGSLQFEVGIQTLNPVVAQNVSRKNDLSKVSENFKFIKDKTHIHTHADLIVGLPGESLNSFAEGFDQLHKMNPDEIQVGILKRLKGTPIIRHEKNFQMIYSDFQPYQILSTSTMTYQELQQMNRFAKFWDLYANSGQFRNFMSWFRQQESFFWSFFDFTETLSKTFSEIHSLSLMTLAEQAWNYLQSKGLSVDKASEVIIEDYCQGVKKRDLPNFLKKQGPEFGYKKTEAAALNKRQLQHLSHR